MVCFIDTYWVHKGQVLKFCDGTWWIKDVHKSGCSFNLFYPTYNFQPIWIH